MPRFGRSGAAPESPTATDPNAAVEHDDRSPTVVMSVPAATPPDAPASAPVPAAAAEVPAAGSEGQVPPPAGTDPAPEPSLSFAERARARRRLRFLRRARELGFRDLGGLVFDLHRYDRERNDLVAAKVHTLTVMDQELRALETLLKERRTATVLHEPGIVACPRCAAIHGTETNYCPNCGLPTGGRADMPMAVPGPGASGSTGEWPVVSVATSPVAPVTGVAPTAPAEPAAAAAAVGVEAPADNTADGSTAGAEPPPTSTPDGDPGDERASAAAAALAAWRAPSSVADSAATSSDDRPRPR